MKLIKRIVMFLILVILIFICLIACKNIKQNNIKKLSNASIKDNINNEDIKKKETVDETITTSSVEEDKEAQKQEENKTKEEVVNSNNNTQAEIETKEEVQNNSENYQNKEIKLIDFDIYMEKTTIEVGETVQVKLVINPENLPNKTIKIATGNSKIASVAGNLTITGKQVGSCNIYITVNDLRRRFVVNVISKENQNNEQQNTSENIIVTPANYNVQQSNENTVSHPTPQQPAPQQPAPQQQTTQIQNMQQEKDKVVENKNGWVIENNKKYYYKNNQKLKNQFVEYIYLDQNGVAQAKIGEFDATIYKATAWANQVINIRENPSQNSKKLGEVPRGGKIILLSAEDSKTKYIKMEYAGKIGYVYSDYIYINLPDVIPGIQYEITNADKSIFKTSDTNIPGVTNESLYGFTKNMNNKIGKETYYAPMLYPVAKQLQAANRKAVQEGYNFKVYDTYRPYDVSQKINNLFRQLYQKNQLVKKNIDYDRNGNYWGPGWFLANGTSGHNRGTDIDMTLTDLKGNELKAQTPMHTLDSRSVVAYNNDVANKLRQIMTSSGFETLKSEWWHFQEDSYRGSEVNSFRLS